MVRSSVDAASVRDLMAALHGAPLPRADAVAPAPDILVALCRLVPSDLVVFNDLAPYRRAVWAQSCSLADDELGSPAGEPEVDFWDAFSSSQASYPDRTGDRVSVTALSDFWSVREWRQSLMHFALRDTLDFDRHLLLPLSGPPGHSRRIRFLRLRGKDYDDTDRAVATLIRPHLIEHLHTLDMVSRGTAPLTTRQRQLVSLVGGGYTNQQISRTLGITPATVRTHLQQIYARLGVTSRSAAVAMVSSTGGEVAARTRLSR